MAALSWSFSKALLNDAKIPPISDDLFYILKRYAVVMLLDDSEPNL